MRAVVAWVRASLRAAGWAPGLVLVTHFLMSEVFNAYAVVPSLDAYEHSVGGIAIGFFFWRSFSIPECASAIGSFTRAGKRLLTLASVCAAAVVWEFTEWITDRLAWTQAQTSLDDTLLDLLLGIIGALTFLAAAGFPRRPHDPIGS